MKSRSRIRSVVRVAPLNFWGGRASSFIFVLTSIVLLAISVASPDAFQGARSRTIDLFSPFLGAISAPFQQMAEAIGSVSGLSELRAENAALKQENERLREWYQTALMLQADNKSLQELLNVKTDPQHSFVTARVISDSGNSYVHSVLVAAGSDDGVEKGQAVMAGSGLIGRIIETGRSAGRVLLLTDLNSHIPVLVEGSRQHAILAGTNERFPQLMHLPPDTSIENGARIITSGEGGIFLPGLPIGRVVKDKAGNYTVEPYADSSRLTYVKVVEKSDDPNLQTSLPSP